VNSPTKLQLEVEQIIYEHHGPIHLHNVLLQLLEKPKSSMQIEKENFQRQFRLSSVPHSFENYE
jgi:hypothetical protein